jgi:hypothetical protein
LCSGFLIVFVNGAKRLHEIIDFNLFGISFDWLRKVQSGAGLH